jgi:type IV secretory pathway VirB2 component (pilin)
MTCADTSTASCLLSTVSLASDGQTPNWYLVGTAICLYLGGLCESTWAAVRKADQWSSDALQRLEEATSRALASTPHSAHTLPAIHSTRALFMNRTFITASQATVVTVLCFAAQGAIAAGGGLSRANDEANNFRLWLYGFLGVIAVIVLLYYGLCAWFERKSWSDFAMACVGVAVVGAAPSIATYLWTLFSN